ncbi:hypothetical protein [Streptomyces sp. NPDC051162]|uniref:hypothetical protein n=1 Tax=Streptomyces sp. NPDC051162 TaxID=3154747 RepID=UPI00341EB25B
MANAVRIAVTGLSKISSVADDGAYRALQWDTFEQYGGWSATGTQDFSVPASGFYFLSADFTALSPKDSSKRPALRFVAVNRRSQGESELLRSYNSTIVPNTYITCSLRGVTYMDKDSALIFRANAPAGTGAWEVSPGSRSSGQLNSFAAVLIAPNASR